jgi:hypothetical protein
MRLLCPWPVHGQSRRAFSHRCEDADGASLGIAAMDLLRARLQGPPARRLGPVSTPNCSFLTSQPRLPPATGPASNAGVGTRSSLPKNGAKCTSIASRHTPRRWTTCCTRNAYEDVPNACTDPTSTSCPTAHLLHSMERPSPFVATRSYTGRRRVTMLASRARAGSPSTCSPRQR